MSASQKSLRLYVVGFTLSLLFTLMAFGLVEWRLFIDTHLYIALALLAIAQLLVQSVCFLGLNTHSESRWNVMPFLFTILIIAILVSGTLWIMYNLNYNMT